MNGIESKIAPLLSDRMWVEASCMLFRMSETDLKRLLRTFALHCISGGEDFNLKTARDIKYHFRSYLYKLTPNERETTTTGNVASAQGGIGPGFDTYAQMLRAGEGSDSPLW